MSETTTTTTTPAAAPAKKPKRPKSKSMIMASEQLKKAFSDTQEAKARGEMMVGQPLSFLRKSQKHSVCVLSIQKIILQVLPHRKQPLLSWTMPKVSLDVIMTFVPMPKLIWHMQNFLSALATICLYLIFFLSLTMVVLKQPNGLSCFLVNGTFRYL